MVQRNRSDTGAKDQQRRRVHVAISGITAPLQRSLLKQKNKKTAESSKKNKKNNYIYPGKDKTPFKATSQSVNF